MAEATGMFAEQRHGKEKQSSGRAGTASSEELVVGLWLAGTV